ncbi:hypothetical protein HpKG91_01220 [Helicobacter pylori]
MVEITPNTPQGSLKNCSVMGAILLLIFFRNEGVLYKEILRDACDHLKVSYHEESPTSLIEQNMLSKLLKGSLEKMSGREIKELGHELDMSNIDKMISENKQLLIASILTLFKAGGSHSYALAIAVADAMVKNSRAWFMWWVKSRLKNFGRFGWAYWLGHHRRVSERQSCRAGL